MTDLKQATGVAETVPHAAPARHSAAAAAPNPNRLLVLDDNEEFLSLMERYGSALGFETASAVNTPGFVAKYAKFKPSMILLDVFLKTDMSTSVIDFLVRQRFKGPIVIVSGQDYRFLVSVAGIARQLGLQVMETVEKGRNVDQIPALLRRGLIEPATAAVVACGE